MKLQPVLFLIVGLLLMAVSFAGGLFVQQRFALLGGKADPDPQASGDPKPVDEKERDNQKKRTALVNYLDGKELKSAEQKFAGVDGKLLIMRKYGIEKMQFSDTATKWGNDPWSTSVDLVAQVGGKRYVIQARIEYLEIANDISIVSFTPKQVSPQ